MLLNIQLYTIIVGWILLWLNLTDSKILKKKNGKFSENNI